MDSCDLSVQLSMNDLRFQFELQNNQWTVSSKYKFTNACGCMLTHLSLEIILSTSLSSTVGTCWEVSYDQWHQFCFFFETLTPLYVQVTRTCVECLCFSAESGRLAYATPAILSPLPATCEEKCWIIHQSPESSELLPLHLVIWTDDENDELDASSLRWVLQVRKVSRESLVLSSSLACFCCIDWGKTCNSTHDVCISLYLFALSASCRIQLNLSCGKVFPTKVSTLMSGQQSSLFGKWREIKRHKVKRPGEVHRMDVK